MTYGLRYSSDFDSFQPLLTYRLEIFKKDFTGANQTILLSGNPAIHEWQDDDPKTPIKGSTLKVSILTESSGVKLTDFYSEDDYVWACVFRRKETDEILFQGYLLQDDSQELQVDFTHEIQLTFTDGLGLLKDVTLDQAAIISGVIANHSVLIGTPPGTLNTITTQDIRFGGLQPGTVFTINDGSLAGTYTIISISLIPTLGVYDYWIVTNQIIGYTLPYTASIDWIVPYPLTGYIPLIDIYKLCLKSTYINIGLNCYTRLFPVGGTNERLLDDTFIQAETFLKSDLWMNCYDILEQINSRFNLSLFQAKGIWNLMRWDELYRYTTNPGATLQYHTYSSDFVYTATSNNSDFWTFKSGNDMETGVLKSINRANQFVKETFNYVQPESLLCNYNIKDLGALIQENNIGLVTIRDYGLNSWYDGPFSPYPDRFIRITFDNDPTSETYLQEQSREALISGNSGSGPQSAKSCDIPISKGDGVEIDFKYRTSNSEPGPVNNVFIITLNDGTNIYKLNNNGTWTLSGGFTYSIPTGDNANIYHDVNIRSNEVPVSGIINVYLDQASSSLDQTFYKDFVFTINYFINKSLRIIGHTHKDSQSQEIKNNIDKEILIDDSPKVSINGALFLESYTNLVRDLTVRWQYPGGSYNYARLGEGTTQESLFTTYKMRSKYEGKYLFINQEDVMLNNLALFVDNQNYNFFRYAPGRMAIDYKNGHADLSLWEIIDSPSGNFQPGGAGITFDYLVWAATKLYEFNYLYEKS